MIEKHQILNFGNVVAHGLDVVDMVDFSRLMNEQASDFLDRYFTPGNWPLRMKEATGSRGLPRDLLSRRPC